MNSKRRVIRIAYVLAIISVFQGNDLNKNNQNAKEKMYGGLCQFQPVRQAWEVKGREKLITFKFQCGVSNLSTRDYKQA